MSSPQLAIYSRVYHGQTIFVIMIAPLYGIHCALYIAAVATFVRRSLLLIMIIPLLLTSTVYFLVNYYFKIAVALAPYRPDIVKVRQNIATYLLIFARVNHVLSDVVVQVVGPA
ncbi:hypothetical protein BD626DRAFT_576952 [Schizophyllum amplum]|uniref:Uncharacterized protein n=1 Tax=Schizophyllum amplum TaxID=97359 RepID=A0A550BSV7_9AGAR|nr:hypothetical protein BD626DRAFT_576952 [Auriculariopsis ampla]